MDPSRRVALLLAAVGLLGPAWGCAGRQGSSFETLGVPEPEDRRGQAPLILGWAYEDRSGWLVDRVRVDGETRAEWSSETERPVVIYLEPGPHELRLFTAQLRESDDRSARPRRRYRTSPVQVDLEEGVAQLCTIRVEGDERRRPNVRCQARELAGAGPSYDEDEEDYGDEEYDEYDDEAEARPSPPAPSGPPAGPPPVTEPPAPAGPVPDPFATPAAPARPAPAATPAPVPPTAPVAPETTPPVAPRPGPGARPVPPPRPLSIEERVERLERQLEELRRQITN